MKAVAVIPARYGSSRLPGKPLLDILGKPMIQHVYERVASLQRLHAVVVATDDERIYAAVEGFGGKVMMTSPSHQSGTDRLIEVKAKFPADIYLNVQGDEPLLNPNHVEHLLTCMEQDSSVDMATLCHAISTAEALDSSSVKVVIAQTGNALYFSRSPIPYPRDQSSKASYLKHIGVYGYRNALLDAYASLPDSALERTEMLEQLRVLDAGFQIKVLQVNEAAPGVDTPACLERVRRIMAGTSTAEKSLADVRLVIADVDGVLTDGGLFYDETGESVKRFHVRDGMGIKMLQACGVEVAIVSGRESATLIKRIRDLGISNYVLGVKDKSKACLDLMEKMRVEPFETACLGDDSIDLPAFKVCGWSVAVADSEHYIKARASLVLKKGGGAGAFREFSDMVLASKGMSDVYSLASGYERVMNDMAQ